MSKSLGNSLLVTEMLERVRPVDLRYYLGAAHYRSNIEFHEDSLDRGAAAYGRIEGFVPRAGASRRRPDGRRPRPSRARRFAAAMDDDLNVSAALAVVHDTVRDGQHRAGPRGDEAAARGARPRARRCSACSASTRSTSPGPRARRRRPARHGARRAGAVAARAARRRPGPRKDFAAADAVRDRLAAAGVVVEDTPDGAALAAVRTR